MTDGLKVDSPLATWVDSLGWEWEFESNGLWRLYGRILAGGPRLILATIEGDAKKAHRYRLVIYNVADIAAEGLAADNEVLPLATAWALLKLVLANPEGVGWELKGFGSDNMLLQEKPGAGQGRTVFEIGAQAGVPGWRARWAVDQEGPRGDNRLKGMGFDDRKAALACCVDKAMGFASKLGLLDGRPPEEAPVDDTPIDLDQLARTRAALERLPG